MQRDQLNSSKITIKNQRLVNSSYYLYINHINISLTEARNEQKNTRIERKSHDKNFEMITQAKKVWEQLRRGDISREEQKQLMEKIMNIIGGKVQDVIFKHDASRIIQTCLKKGNAEQRNQIAEELKGRYLELAKSMYGKFIVMKAIEYW